MMLSGQVHLCHLLAPKLTYVIGAKGDPYFRRTVLLDRFQAGEIIIEA
jgi:hypothetical protein